MRTSALISHHMDTWLSDHVRTHAWTSIMVYGEMPRQIYWISHDGAGITHQMGTLLS